MTVQLLVSVHEEGKKSHLGLLILECNTRRLTVYRRGIGKLFAADCLSEHEVLCRLAANDVSVDTGLVYTFLWGPTPSVDDHRRCAMSD